jgi:lipoprotein-releasing system permease protein
VFSRFEWMVAARYLRSRRREGFISVITWFSLLGIALGVATLIIVMSVMNGFREELLSRILGINGHLSIYGTTHKLTGFDPMAKKVRKLPGVVKVIPLIEGQIMATARGIATGAVVRGIRPADLKKRDIVSNKIQAGSLNDFKGNHVVIGERLARKLGIGVGGKITLISPKGKITAFGSVPRMPLKAAQIYFQLPNAVSNLEVFVTKPNKARDIGLNILQSVKGTGRLHDWQQANKSFFNAIQVERNVMFLILTLIILVAAFNIISSLIMLVKDKGRDIAILRTMGATRGMIMRIFFLAGASIGIIGTMVGLGLGMAFTQNIEAIRQWIQSLTGTELFAAEIYFLSQLPAVVDPAEVVAVVLMGLGLSFLATLYPSWRAARLDPAEALRYE